MLWTKSRAAQQTVILLRQLGFQLGYIVELVHDLFVLLAIIDELWVPSRQRGGVVVQGVLTVVVAAAWVFVGGRGGEKNITTVDAPFAVVVVPVPVVLEVSSVDRSKKIFLILLSFDRFKTVFCVPSPRGKVVIMLIELQQRKPVLPFQPLHPRLRLQPPLPLLHLPLPHPQPPQNLITTLDLPLKRLRIPCTLQRRIQNLKLFLFNPTTPTIFTFGLFYFRRVVYWCCRR